MNSYAERCNDAETAVRAKCPPGWIQSRAWVGVHFAKPKTEAERRALEIFQERFPRAISVHAYDVVDLLAEVLERELEDHRG